MSIRVLVFDPLKSSEVARFERDLDFYLADGWEMLTTIAGSRPGVNWGGTPPRLSKVKSPESKDYIVCILRNSAFSQEAMEQSEVTRRSQ